MTASTPPEAPTNGHPESRRHFLVDINTVFGLLGKRYFLIFYFGRHLHPRQRELLVNQRTAGNWIVIALVLFLVAGFVFGIIEIISWRLGNDTASPEMPASFTQLNAPHMPRV